MAVAALTLSLSSPVQAIDKPVEAGGSKPIGPSSGSAETNGDSRVLTLGRMEPNNTGGDGCRPEPASVWAPAGYVCPPRYGYGTASRYPGESAAMNFCSWKVRHSTGCGMVAVTSLDTGIRIVTEVGEWCHCYVGVTGPHGETERLIDLTPDLVAALGLRWSDGLYDVLVEPVEQVLLPNTAASQ